MNVFDIVLTLPLIYALWKGFKDGVIVQLGGIVAVFIGVWLAFKYAAPFGAWLKIDPEMATIAGFIVIILASIIAIGILGWLLSKLFDFVGLGLFNKIGGVILSLVKMVLILSVLLTAFNALNRKTEMVSPKQLESSIYYKPLTKVSEVLFPYLESLKDKFLCKAD